MDTGDPEPDPPPFLVSLSPFSSPSARRLSSCFTEPSCRPIRPARQLAWVSLQGRLIGAEEASSSNTLARENGLFLDPKEALAWELFSPIHRILIVAVIAVAAANSKRDKEILQLKKAVDLRDQVLSSMEEKLDNLCEQVSYFKDQPEAVTEKNCCQHCQQNKPPLISVVGNSVLKAPNGDEMSRYTWNEAEAEERRMSELSDWASSVTSSSELLLNSLAIEQDIYNLRKECEDKDATIKELSAFVRSSEVFGSKRIAELEDIIRRKNMTITRLKKDMMVLEQKVVNLTRTRRPSFSGTVNNDKQLPLMLDNLLYNLDSSTGPSSSDSDNSPGKRTQTATAKMQQPLEISLEGEKELRQVNSSGSLLNSRVRSEVSSSPLKEKSLNQVMDGATISRLKLNSPASEISMGRRRSQTRAKEAVGAKRWV